MKSISGQLQHQHHHHHRQQQQHEPTTAANGLARSMAEKLGLGPEVRELKLGTTFTGDRSTAFHTLKYDFKPASVDTTKMATVDVGQNNMMTVTVPHLDGAGTTHTVFKGSQRPCQKECVLIIDRNTGEITLERLTANIQVKKTRSETKHAPLLAVPSSLRPITPIEPGKSPTNGRTKSRTKVTSGKKREPSHQLRPKTNPHRASYHTKSPPSTITSSSYSSVSSSAMPSSTQSMFASLPMINEHDDYCAPSIISKPPSHSTAPPRTISPAPPPRNVSPAPPKMVSPAVSEKPTVKISTLDNEVGILSDSSSSSSSDSSDSDSEPESKPPPTNRNGYPENGTKTSPPLSLPDNLLSEDLQLSESESDSD